MAKGSQRSIQTSFSVIFQFYASILDLEQDPLLQFHSLDTSDLMPNCQET